MLVLCLYPPDRASFDTCVHGTWEEAEFIGRGSYRKINSVPPTLLPLRAKTYATLISFYNFFLQFFSYLTSPLTKSLKRHVDVFFRLHQIQFQKKVKKHTFSFILANIPYFYPKFSLVGFISILLMLYIFQ